MPKRKPSTSATFTYAQIAALRDFAANAAVRADDDGHPGEADRFRTTMERLTDVLYLADTQGNATITVKGR